MRSLWFFAPVEPPFVQTSEFRPAQPVRNFELPGTGPAPFFVQILFASSPGALAGLEPASSRRAPVLGTNSKLPPPVLGHDIALAVFSKNGLTKEIGYENHKGAPRQVIGASRHKAQKVSLTLLTLVRSSSFTVGLYIPRAPVRKLLAETPRNDSIESKSPTSS